MLFSASSASSSSMSSRPVSVTSTELKKLKKQENTKEIFMEINLELVSADVAEIVEEIFEVETLSNHYA
jgi:septation ring formation regulator EzrA